MSSAERKVALVTAGAAGIGHALVTAFDREGYRVHTCDIDEAAIDRLAGQNDSVTAHHTDVADPGAVAALIETIAQREGRLDVLINNAGIAGPTAPVEEISNEDWQRTVAVDLSAAFYCCRAAVPLIKAQGGGSIIFMASNAGLFGYPFRLPYAVSKWGLIGMTKTLAMELGADQIRVNALCPGSVNGERIDGVIQRDARQRGVSEEEIRRVYQRQSSMRCFVNPQEIASMALYLCSAAGARISGQTIAIDGHTESLSNYLT